MGGRKKILEMFVADVRGSCVLLKWYSICIPPSVRNRAKFAEREI